LLGIRQAAFPDEASGYGVVPGRRHRPCPDRSGAGLARGARLRRRLLRRGSRHSRRGRHIVLSRIVRLLASLR